MQNQSSEIRTRDVFCGLERRTREKKQGNKKACIRNRNKNKKQSRNINVKSFATRVRLQNAVKQR